MTVMLVAVVLIALAALGAELVRASCRRALKTPVAQAPAVPMATQAAAAD